MQSAFPHIVLSGAAHTVLPGTSTDAEFAALVRERTADDAVYVFLRSGGPADRARYSIAGFDPVAVFEGKNGEALLSDNAGRSQFIGGQSLPDVFGALVEDVHHDIPGGDGPFSGGFMGYIAYDIKNAIERLPQSAVDDLQLPDIFQILPSLVYVHDRAEGTVTELRFTGSIQWDDEPHAELPAWSALSPEHAMEPVPQMSESEYKSAVQRIREYIRNGDVYQANLAQRYAFPAPDDTYGFWDELYRINPAPYFAYINTPRHRVLSTSMERCVRQQGRALRSQPIKGTRPRGGTTMADAAMIAELRNDPKENAELSMIVDLVRNDLSRISKPGSVKVTVFPQLDSYANVHHLSSVIDGKLRAGVPITEILKALLPAGSVTGCPKIRAMEIIDELEPVARHVYTGSIGYIGLHGTMDLNVAIRTAVCTARRMFVSFGSGIVYDSDPAREFQETLDKGETFFTLIRNLQQ